MSSIGGYRSPVDLGIGQVPLTVDPELFPEMTGVYNAIHLLNQYLDQLRVVAEGGGGSGQTPSESMPFNRFFVSTALQTIAVGQLVSPSAIPGQNGIVLGGLPHDFTSLAPECNFGGVGLISAAIGTDARVGIGPAVLEVPGAVTSQLLWGYPQRATNGNLFGVGTIYTSNPGPLTNGAGTAYPMPVATCPKDGFALFGQFIKR